MKRNYSDYDSLYAIEQCILEDVRAKGYSEGWLGDFETFSVVKEKLKNSSITYFYLGHWSSDIK